MTSTVAGVSRGVRPSRLALSATVLVFNGVVVAFVVPACAGAWTGAGAADRARLIRPALPDGDGGARPGLPGDTTAGSSVCEASFGAACARGAAASMPSTINDEENQYLEMGECAKRRRPRDAKRHPGML